MRRPRRSSLFPYTTLFRSRNDLAPGTEGPWTIHRPSRELLTIFDAAERYRAEGVPLIVLAGKEYGSGSSRDWAAKGPSLLGDRKSTRLNSSHANISHAVLC